MFHRISLNLVDPRPHFRSVPDFFVLKRAPDVFGNISLLFVSQFFVPEVFPPGAVSHEVTAG